MEVQPIDDESRRRRRRKGKQKAAEESTSSRANTHQSGGKEDKPEPSSNVRGHGGGGKRAIKRGAASPLLSGDILQDSTESSLSIASSSKLSSPPQVNGPVSTSRKRSRESKGERSALKQTIEESRTKKSKKEKGNRRERQVEVYDERYFQTDLKGKGKQKAGVEVAEFGIPAWPCVPLGQNDVLRIPPVWSRDAR